MTWSPLEVGAGIGVLSWLTFYFMNKPIGASSFYAGVAGLAAEQVAPEHVRKLPYYRKHPPKLDVFLLGALLGAIVGAVTGGVFHLRFLPELWTERFGEGSYLLRILACLAGGALMGFGARLAGGCTSGHGISGTLQLAVSSWIVVCALFASGVVTALWMFA